MSYITNNLTITLDGITWWVNAKASGLVVNAIKAMINQVNAMISHHSKVHLLRFDLRMSQYTHDNKIITIFNRRLHRWLIRQYQVKSDRIGYIWCREMEKATQQHYHCVLMIDGHKVRHPIKVLEKIREIWKDLGGSEYTPKNCYYNLHRDNYESRQKAIWRISYLAKARGKGCKPSQTKNYSTSRIKKAQKV
ncbi:YagK/YfjJ domain-containing protein [Shewanella sp. OMA3-2]|uniref:YagK/YfjJ domain-containing protein n=1 Tax=Shewanella sp. OMA3-2 TaxID=2908650 RepID=UPI001F2735EB|nr:inovirus-type Gp2 protein [Shewanella sp. OMA3-2]UJF21502.1 inovirus Gp2 family protein [Shewanella sp. OMA3-2]